MNLEDIQRNIRAHHDKVLAEEGREEWAMSCNAIPGLDRDAIAVEAKRPNPRVSESSTDALAQIGVLVWPDDPPRPDGHSNVYFGHDPDISELQAIHGKFVTGFKNEGQPKPEYKS